MHIVLATGIYPPDIGGPATYVQKLAEQLVQKNVRVTILAYGEPDFAPIGATPGKNGSEGSSQKVIRISRRGGSFVRWTRYARAIRTYAADADIIYGFSSVSVGVPLFLSHIKGPRKVLRLGGDFAWERYTDRGGTLSLRDWSASKPWFFGAMNGLLKTFDHLVFSTIFQQELYEKFYTRLPLHSVIENALPTGTPVLHAKHDPFRLLFLGRFVGFKNLGSLFMALKDLPSVELSCIGDGPLVSVLQNLAHECGIEERVHFSPPVSGDAKHQVFLDHDLLILPSYTELSPNVALEARVAGLPVLLTEQTGLSRQLNDGMQLRPLLTQQEITSAIRDAIVSYDTLAQRAASVIPERNWETVSTEHLSLFQSLL